MKPAPQNHLIAHTDGGARGNPGPAGYGVIIRDALGNKIAALSQYLGRQTNNFAEYQALIQGTGDTPGGFCLGTGMPGSMLGSFQKSSNLHKPWTCP